MKDKGFKNHPYIPNSGPEIQREMLDYLGLSSLEELHTEIPDELKLNRPMNLPKPFGSEYELRRSVEKLLAKNTSAKERSG